MPKLGGQDGDPISEHDLGILGVGDRSPKVDVNIYTQKPIINSLNRVEPEQTAADALVRYVAKKRRDPIIELHIPSHIYQADQQSGTNVSGMSGVAGRDVQSPVLDLSQFPEIGRKRPVTFADLEHIRQKLNLAVTNQPETNSTAGLHPTIPMGNEPTRVFSITDLPPLPSAGSGEGLTYMVGGQMIRLSSAAGNRTGKDNKLPEQLYTPLIHEERYRDRIINQLPVVSEKRIPVSGSIVGPFQVGSGIFEKKAEPTREAGIVRRQRPGKIPPAGAV